MVTFVAFLLTYEAESSVLAEERRPPENWQVKSLLLFEIVMMCRNIRVNCVNVNPL